MLRLCLLGSCEGGVTLHHYSNDDDNAASLNDLQANLAVILLAEQRTNQVGTKGAITYRPLSHRWRTAAAITFSVSVTHPSPPIHHSQIHQLAVCAVLPSPLPTLAILHMPQKLKVLEVLQEAGLPIVVDHMASRYLE
jgi:hypothetical protein